MFLSIENKKIKQDKVSFTRTVNFSIFVSFKNGPYAAAMVLSTHKVKKIKDEDLMSLYTSRHHHRVQQTHHYSLILCQ